jgi:serine/threonine protein kinase
MDGGGALTSSSSFVGSPLYSPPEQLMRSHAVDKRADIWSLGTILFESLAGRLPFEGDSAMHVASRIFSEQPASLAELRPDLPPQLCHVVMRCLRKRPEERFQNVSELTAALAPFAPAHSISAERVARIVAADRVPNEPALAETAQGSRDVTNRPVSARTPPASASRRRAGAIVALGACIGVTALLLRRARTDSPPPALAEPSSARMPPDPRPIASAPADGSTEDRVRLELAPVDSAPSATAHATASAQGEASAFTQPTTAPARPARGAPRRNPLTVDVK